MMKAAALLALIASPAAAEVYTCDPWRSDSGAILMTILANTMLWTDSTGMTTTGMVLENAAVRVFADPLSLYISSRTYKPATLMVRRVFMGAPMPDSVTVCRQS